MANPFTENPFNSVYAASEFRSLVQGLTDNRHFCFEFPPFSGDRLLAVSLASRLRKEGFLVFSIDLRMVTGPWHLAEMLARTTLDVLDEPAKKAAMMRRLAVAGPVRIERNETGDIVLEVPSRSDLPKFLASLFDLPEVSGMEEEKRAVVIISGFERMAKILDKGTRDVFFQKVGRQAITSYLLFGNDIAREASRMEGRISNQVTVRKASDLFGYENVLGWVSRKFREAKRDLSEGVLEQIEKTTCGKVEHTLKLAHALFELFSDETPLDETAVATSSRHIVEASAFSYTALWNILNARQKSLLYGLGREANGSIYSEKFLTTYGFGTATNLQAALRGLHQKGIVVKDGKRWDFADPFFKVWVNSPSAC